MEPDKLVAMPGRRMPKRALEVAAAIAAGALLPALLQYSILGSAGAIGQMVQAAAQYLILSLSIGGLAFIVMPYVGPAVMRFGLLLRWTLILSAMVATGITGCLLALAIFVAMGDLSWAEYWPQFYRIIRVTILITLIIGISRFVYETLRHRLMAAQADLKARQQEAEHARQAAVEARLASLESRVHPHFLFNTLNSISALIREDPRAAERTVERLAALLRFSLDSQAGSVVLLRREMRIVVDYLEIEHTRFGDRLQYDIDIPPALEDCEVPPMAVQTLVENCVKHAISPCRAGGAIHIAALSRDAVLELAVWDNGPGFDSESIVAGHGLDNLRTRLSVLFGEMGTLRIAQRGEHTAVVLAMPLRMAPDEVAR